jgi:drug/metabolite transporter (DMT)-like permease
MSSWYIFAIFALILLGFQRFLYKVSAERKCNTAWTTFSFMATVAILSSTLFVVLGESVSDITFLFFIALVNSGAFLVATITHIEALKHIPTSVVYPIIRLNAVVVVIFSILYFKDRLSLYQGIGIVLALAVIVILALGINDNNAPRKNISRGFIFVVIALFGGAVAAISSKFAAGNTNKMAFIAVSYIASTLFSFGLRKKLQTEETHKMHKDDMIIGVIMGLINFAGYYSFLKALSTGPLSIIASITGMHFVISIILSALIYKEKLTLLRILGIFLTVLSIILLRL